MSTITTDWQASPVEQDSDEQGVDFIKAILSRKFLLFTFVLLGIVVGHLHYTRQPPVFASFAKVMVIRPQGELVPDERERSGQPVMMRDVINNHLYLITQPTILSGALPASEVGSDSPKSSNRKLSRDGSLLSLPTLAASPNPTATIAQGLRVTRSDVTDDVLEIMFTGPNQGDCKLILEGVLASYLRWLRESQSGTRDEMTRLLKEAQLDLVKKLDANRDEHQQFRNNEGKELLIQNDKGVNLYEDRVKMLEEKRYAVTLELKRLEVLEQSLTDALRRGASKEALLLMANMFKSDDSATGSNEKTASLIHNPFDPFLKEVMPLMVDRDTLLETVGEGHPQIKKLDRRIEYLRNTLREETGTGGGPPKDMLTITMEAITERIAALRREFDELERKFVTENGLARELQVVQRTDAKYVEERAELSRLFDAVVGQLSKLDLAKDANALQATVTTPPTVGVQVGPNMLQSLGFGGVGGLLAAVAVCLLLETADKSFRNPDEISRQLKLPVIGHIPELAVDRDYKNVKDNQIDASISVHHRPRSRLAESYRAVRAAVFFGTRGQTHRVLQVTSANSGDGKTTLCANLASAIAMSGKKCLLIDCDLRRPRVHRLFGCQLDVGVSSVVRDGMELPDAIQATRVPNLDVMTIGPRVENPAELLLSPEFGSMILRLREKYEFVMIDTPPILIVTDPAAVAAHVDGVILVVRNTKRSRPQTKRVRETLDLIGARVLGVVVNGISERAAGYGYGDSYSYSYTSSNRAGGKGYYGRYYSDDRSGSYYDESRKRR